MFFSSERFQAVLADYQREDQRSGWTHVTDSAGLSVYKRPRASADNAGLFQYKAYGVLDTVHSTAFQVYMDIDYRRKWDNYKSEHLYVRTPSPSSSPVVAAGNYADAGEKPESIYWRVKYPLFMSDRDYVFVRQAKEMMDEHGQPCFVVLAQTDPEELSSKTSMPVCSGVIRVTDYEQSLVFAPGPDPESQTTIYMQYFDNPKGAIPTAVVNWAVSTGVPTFLKNLTNACKNYSSMGAIPISGNPAGVTEGVQDLKETLDKSLATAFAL